MAIGNQTASQKIYRIKITLDGIKPTIWRRVEVVGTTTLEEMHYIIQIAMGWTNSHLHEFVIGRQRIGGPDEMDDFDFEPPDNAAEQVQLLELPLKAKDKFSYLYDFGDSWAHTLLVEATLELNPTEQYPRCLAGKNACPPDDCGGIPGYANMLEALADPKHPAHEDMVEWIGPEFDSEDFDLESVNDQLLRFTNWRQESQVRE